MISMLSLFECIMSSWSVSFKEIKLIAFVEWIFYGSGFSRLFMTPFKYSLI